MKIRLIGALVTVAVLILLVFSVPLASFVARVERERLVTALESDAFVLAGHAKEFDLLAFLSSEPGVVFRRNDILEHVWDTNWYGTTKTLDAHIASIRKKLGSPDWIQSVRGVGFKFVEVPQ